MDCCSFSTTKAMKSRDNYRVDGEIPAESTRFRHQIPQVVIPEGAFYMGDCFDEGYPADGETPVHRVRLAQFAMDATTVSVADFRHFIEATGYVTEAEYFGSSGVFHLELHEYGGYPQGSMPVPSSPWWVIVPGASWHAPYGPGSQAKDDHPVVHVSWNDAQAYCSWAGRALPSEAQWEYAARGGLREKRYSWGNELVVQGEHQCNIFQGQFPKFNTVEDGYLATAPGKAFPPNRFGLYQMAGNVWEWCYDWFASNYYAQSPVDNPAGPSSGDARVMRGGSFLCHESYCNRYRVAARSRNTPDSSSSNCGFRTVSNRT